MMRGVIYLLDGLFRFFGRLIATPRCWLRLRISHALQDIAGKAEGPSPPIEPLNGAQSALGPQERQRGPRSSCWMILPLWAAAPAGAGQPCDLRLQVALLR